jgi:hypothetical protein
LPNAFRSLGEILKAYSKEVIRCNPQDIVQVQAPVICPAPPDDATHCDSQFSANYFRNLSANAQQHPSE